MFDSKLQQHYPTYLEDLDPYSLWRDEAKYFCLARVSQPVKIALLYMMACEYSKLEDKPDNPDINFFEEELNYWDDEENNEFINQIRILMDIPTSPYVE